MDIESPIEAIRTGDVNLLSHYFDEKSLSIHAIASSFGNISLLHCACFYNQKEIIHLLVHRGADLNKPSEGGLTPLHYVCIINGSLDTVKTLISLGADPYTLTPDGRNAFSIACRYNKKDIVAYLGHLMYPN